MRLNELKRRIDKIYTTINNIINCQEQGDLIELIEDYYLLLDEYNTIQNKELKEKYKKNKKSN